jgi:hypothetical protein
VIKPPIKQSAYNLAIVTVYFLFCSFASAASAPSAPVIGFLITDLTMKDRQSPLVWTRNGNIKNSQMSWHDAVEYVKVLNRQKYAGHSDWRLPDVDDMRRLAAAVRKAGAVKAFAGDTTIASELRKLGFKNVQSGEYWTSRTSIFNEAEASYYSMMYGNSAMGNKSLYMHVWPVRWQD